MTLILINVVMKASMQSYQPLPQCHKPTVLDNMDIGMTFCLIIKPTAARTIRYFNFYDVFPICKSYSFIKTSKKRHRRTTKIGILTGTELGHLHKIWPLYNNNLRIMTSFTWYDEWKLFGGFAVGFRHWECVGRFLFSFLSFFKYIAN